QLLGAQPSGAMKAIGQGKLSALAGNKAWVVAAGAGLVFIAILAVTSAFVLHARTTTTDQDSEVVAAPDATTPPVQTPLDERVREAIAMINRGDNASGIKVLEELGPAAEDREDVHKALFNAYSATGRPKEALREARLWLKANPNLDVSKEDKLRLEV